jgi:cytochrome bd-type quinol oxidase subunit 2
MPYIILSILIFLLIIAMIIFRFREENYNEKAPTTSVGVPTESVGKNSENPEDLEEKTENKRKIKIGLLVAVLIGVVLTIILKERGVISSNSDSDFNVAVFIPIWVAVFVPFIVNQKKKRLGNSEISDSQKRIALIIGTLLLLFAFGFLIFNSMK